MAITETELHGEESEVISWRRAALRRAGYDEESAEGTRAQYRRRPPSGGRPRARRLPSRARLPDLRLI